MPTARPSAAALAAAQAQGQAQATSAAANGAPSAAPQQISGNGGWTLPPAGALVRAGSPNGTRAPTGMDRLLAAGARAVDAAVAAAPPRGPAPDISIWSAWRVSKRRSRTVESTTRYGSLTGIGRQKSE